MKVNSLVQIETALGKNGLCSILRKSKTFSFFLLHNNTGPCAHFSRPSRAIKYWGKTNCDTFKSERHSWALLVLSCLLWLAAESRYFHPLNITYLSRARHFSFETKTKMSMRLTKSLSLFSWDIRRSAMFGEPSENKRLSPAFKMSLKLWTHTVIRLLLLHSYSFVACCLVTGEMLLLPLPNFMFCREKFHSDKRCTGQRVSKVCQSDRVLVGQVYPFKD